MNSRGENELYLANDTRKDIANMNARVPILLLTLDISQNSTAITMPNIEQIY